MYLTGVVLGAIFFLFCLMYLTEVVLGANFSFFSTCLTEVVLGAIFFSILPYVSNKAKVILEANLFSVSSYKSNWSNFGSNFSNLPYFFWLPLQSNWGIFGNTNFFYPTFYSTMPTKFSLTKTLRHPNWCLYCEDETNSAFSWFPVNVFVQAFEMRNPHLWFHVIFSFLSLWGTTVWKLWKFTVISHFFHKISCIFFKVYWEKIPGPARNIITYIWNIEVYEYQNFHRVLMSETSQKNIGINTKHLIKVVENTGWSGPKFCANLVDLWSKFCGQNL